MQLSQNQIAVLSLANDCCTAMINAPASSLYEFVGSMTVILPQLYSAMLEEVDSGNVSEFYSFSSHYVDEDYYNSIRLGLETLLGEHDSYLETFEEDMKYSDTPIAASVAESLADIFQPLFNFTEAVRESEGASFADAFGECADAFQNYWSQTLCNVLRPLNQLRLNPEIQNIQ